MSHIRPRSGHSLTLPIANANANVLAPCECELGSLAWRDSVTGVPTSQAPYRAMVWGMLLVLAARHCSALGGAFQIARSLTTDGSSRERQSVIRWVGPRVGWDFPCRSAASARSL